MEEEETSVCDLIEGWARNRPDHTAIWFESRRISYQELNHAASNIARILSDRLVRPGDLVPVLATRTWEMVATFLGVLKTGACYVPMDIEAWGEERITSTLERVKASVLVNLGASEYLGFDVVSLDEVKAAAEAAVGAKQGAEQEFVRVQIKPTDLAYIIFTSGTTSRPKGVMVSHYSLLSYVANGDDEIPLNTNPRPEDKTLLTFSPGFDGGTGMAFATLCNGAQLIVSAISDFEIWAAQATIIIITPSMLSAIHDVKACTQLRALIIGGEAPSLPLVRKWSAPGRSIYNGYGPTETTIGCLIGLVDPSKPITLGRPTPNNRLVLLDGDVEADYGEICMMGPCLAVGYYQDEELTAQKYPYWHGERMYRTGDFARRTEYGLEFAGRADSFVKNRGFLVNLDSQVIPMLLETDVHMATAFMHRGRLVSFVTPETIDVRPLRQTLLQLHDAYLVPDQIRAVQVIPLTPNGKADNRALQQLLEAEMPMDEIDYSSRPSIMQTLKRAIADATSLPLSEVLEDRRFWDLGGNSLAALKVISYLRSKNLSLDLKDLLNLSDLSAVCGTIRSKGYDDEEGDDTRQELATGPMTALQSKMAHTALKHPGANASLLRIRILNMEKTPNKTGLKEAWYKVLHRHATFRTVFFLKEELQQVSPELNVDWNEEETTADMLDDTIYARSMDIRSRMLSLDEEGETFSPVNMFHLITVPSVSSILLFSAHHIQADGWSLSIIVDEVQAELLGEQSPQARNSPQFIDVAVAQKQQQANERGISFWASMLQNYSPPPMLNLPKAPPSQRRSPWTSSLVLGLGFDMLELEQAARLRSVVPSTLIYAAWSLVLSNYTLSDRVAFGAVFPGRNLDTVPGVENAVGPVFNTVPVPIDLEDKQTVLEMLYAIHDNLLQMLEFQWSATEVMASMTRENIDRILQTLVVTEYDLPPNEGSLSWVVDSDDVMEFGISLLLERSASNHGNKNDQGLQARILFDNSRYAESSILMLLQYFKSAMESLMDPKVTQLQEVRSKLMGAEEKQFLLQAPYAFDEIASHPSLPSVKEMFEAAVSKWTNLLAVESKRHGDFSYRELGEASSRVATEMKRRLQGKPPKDLVIAVLSDGSPFWIIAIMAVFKAGYICCPIDVGLPAHRVATIIQQSGTSFFLSADQLCLDKVQNGGENDDSFADNENVIIVNEFLMIHKPASIEAFVTSTRPEDTIYLVFTSGSTGVPKGVPLRNRTVLNAVSVPAVRLFAAPGRRIAQLSALGFDMALMEIISSLCYGATLVLKDPGEPFRHLEIVDATFATPSLFSVLSPDDYENLDTVALAGERVSRALADVWSSKVKSLINIYGPSECGCASGTLLLPGGEVSIGRALPGMRFYVLDHHKNLSPLGITGELYMSGVQVVKSYWGSSLNNQDKSPFIPNPFSSEPEHDIIYRTGDLGYWNKDMNIVYMGRVDNQVKVRGFRVELEEVENALLAADGDHVQGVAAIAIKGGTSGLEDESFRIVGFVTPQVVDVKALRTKLSLILPAFARPSQILALPSLPRTANMKLDREALKRLVLDTQLQLDFQEKEGTGDHEKGGHGLSPTEKVIAKAWGDLLGIGGDSKICADDDFVTIGGNSIMAIKAARIITESIGHRIPLSLLIRETILRRLAFAIDQHTAVSSPDSTNGYSFQTYLSMARKGAVTEADETSPGPSSLFPLSYLEEEFFRAHSLSEAKSAFNTVIQFTLHGTINTESLLEALRILVQENPILRSRYIDSGSRPVRQINKDDAAVYHYKGNQWSFKELQDLVDKPFDLAREPLLRAIIWEKDGADGDIELVLIAHHIITDKASLALMLQIISQKYATITGGGESQARDYTQGSYIDWARWLPWAHKQRQSPSQIEMRTEFWEQHLSNVHPIPQLRRQGPRTLLGMPGSSHTIRVPPLLEDPSAPAAATVAVANTANYRPQYSQRLAVAATVLALCSVLGASLEKDVVVGIPYTNRDEPPTDDMLGLFVDQLPVRLRLDTAGGSSLAGAAQLLDAVAEEICRSVENYDPHGLRNAKLDATMDVMIVYDWQSDSLQRCLSLGPDVQVLEPCNEAIAKQTGTLFPLQLSYAEQPGDGGLIVEIDYDPAVVSRELIEVLAKRLPSIVQGLVREQKPESILSDASQAA